MPSFALCGALLAATGLAPTPPVLLWHHDVGG